MKTLYFDITSGISGDMALASLFSLGADIDEFSKVISKIAKKDIKLTLENVMRSGIKCVRLNIEADTDDKEYKHFTDIKRMIAASDIPEVVKGNAINTFRIIAEAESEVHGVDIEEVHFHEVGAIDSLIDIVGVSWCIDKLGIEDIAANHAILGTGTLQMAHGLMPLPAPATIKILHGIPAKQLSDVEGELTTPTGAAILKNFVKNFTKDKSGVIINDTFSTGTMTFNKVTNMLRAVIFDSEIETNKDNVLLMKTNIDDMSGENFGFLLDTLMSIGALDVSYSPAYGKKNRPLYMLTVILPKDNESEIAKTIFKYSTTGGIRIQNVMRLVMGRQIIKVNVEGEEVRVKRLFYEDIEKFSPEWDDCVRASKRLITTPTDVHFHATLLAQKGSAK